MTAERTWGSAECSLRRETVSLLLFQQQVDGYDRGTGTAPAAFSR